MVKKLFFVTFLVAFSILSISTTKSSLGITFNNCQAQYDRPAPPRDRHDRERHLSRELNDVQHQLDRVRDKEKQLVGRKKNLRKELDDIKHQLNKIQGREKRLVERKKEILRTLNGRNHRR